MTSGVPPKTHGGVAPPRWSNRLSRVGLAPLRLAIPLLALCTAPGCSTKEACKELAPSFQMDVLTGPSIPAGSIRSLDVLVTVDTFRIQHTFPITNELDKRRTSFVVNLGDVGRGGFTAAVTVVARDQGQRVVIAAQQTVAGSGDGCNFAQIDLGCTDPSSGAVSNTLLNPDAGCWDISGQFLAADRPKDPAALTIFGKQAQAGLDTAQRVYALLAGEGDVQPVSQPQECDGGGTWTAYKGWSIVRTPGTDNEFTISVRGNSAPDCSATPSFNPLSLGEIRLNRGWRLKELRCAAGVQFATCTGHPGDTVITWRADNNCNQCCLCPKGAQVNVQAVVTIP